MRKSLLTALVAISLCASGNLSAATYYWVGNGGDWADYANHWATTSGGMVYYNQPPAATDDVVFDANSFTLPGQMVSLNPGVQYCQSMDWTGVLNSPSFGDFNLWQLAFNSSLKIYGSLTFASGVTWGYQGDLFFESPTAGQTISFLGVSGPRYIRFNSPSGAWTLTSDIRCQEMFLQAGSLFTDGYTVNLNYQISAPGPGPFTFDAGTSQIIAYEQVILNYSGFSYDLDSATLQGRRIELLNGTVFHKGVIQGSTNTVLIGNNLLADSLVAISSNPSYIASNGSIFDHVEFFAPAVIYSSNQYGKFIAHHNLTVDAANTFDTLTLANAGYTCTLPAGLTQTITGTLMTSTGCAAGVTLNSSTTGSQAHISKTSGVVTCQNLSLRDINATGGATFIANNSFVISNVTGWTVNNGGPRNLYWVGGDGNWNDAAHWSLTSGGPGGECEPTSADNVTFDALSFSSPSDGVHVTAGNISCKNMTWTNIVYPATFENGNNSTGTLTVYGDLSLSSLSNWQFAGTIVLSSSLPNCTLNLQGEVTGPITISGTSIWTVGDSLNCSVLSLNSGTLKSNGKPITVTQLISNTPNPRTLDLDTSHVACTFWDIETGSPNLDADSATIYAVTFWNYIATAFHNIIIGNNVSQTCQFNAPGCTFDHLTGNGDLNANCSSVNIDDAQFNGPLYLQGGTFTFGNVEFRNSVNATVVFNADSCWFNNPGYTVIFSTSLVYNFSWMEANGSCSGLITFTDDLPSPDATISVASGILSCDYLNVTGVDATGGATFNTTNSVIAGNCSGWTILSAAVPQTYYWVGGTGNWSDPLHWSTTSGGPGGGCIPTAIDNAVFDNNSFSVNGETVNLDITTIAINNMTWSSMSVLPVIDYPNANQNTHHLHIYGNLDIGSPVSWLYQGSVNFKTADTNTIRTSAATLFEVNFDDNGDWTLLDSLNAETIHFNYGTFHSGNNNITCNGNIEVLSESYFGTSTIRAGQFKEYSSPATSHCENSRIYTGWLEATGVDFKYVNIPANGIIYTNNCNIHFLEAFDQSYFYNATGNTVDSAIFHGVFYMRGLETFGTADFRHDVFVEDNCTFDTLLLNNAGHNMIITAGITVTVPESMTASATNADNIGIYCLTSGSPVYLICNADTVCLEFMNYQDLQVSGSAVFYGGMFSSDNGNNSGIIWSACIIPYSNVWPGDANYDLTVDNNDVLYVGLAFNEIGATRDTASLNWWAQPCVDWNRIFNNGINIHNADCDGNGTIDSLDLTAVYQNYGLSHPAFAGPPTPPQPAVVADLWLDPQTLYYNSGDFVTIPVKLGTVGNPIANIYGIAYSISYDSSRIVPGSVYMTYPPNWFTPLNNSLSFQRDDWSAAKIDDSQSRTDLTNTSGNGSIAYLHFQIDSMAAGLLPLSVINVNAVDNVGAPTGLTPIGTTLIVDSPLVVMNQPLPLDYNVFPNPTNGNATLTIHAYESETLTIEVLDVTGQIISVQTRSIGAGQNASIEIPLSNQAAGVYFCRINGKITTQTIRIVKSE